MAGRHNIQGDGFQNPTNAYDATWLEVPGATEHTGLLHEARRDVSKRRHTRLLLLGVGCLALIAIGTAAALMVTACSPGGCRGPHSAGNHTISEGESSASVTEASALPVSSSLGELDNGADVSIGISIPTPIAPTASVDLESGSGLGGEAPLELSALTVTHETTKTATTPRLVVQDRVTQGQDP
eukprot:m.460596 g.460596  ORF g.460596 m.460596 type:complete len:184 (+) comp22075_c0_seq1:164-715(+)